ncbi:MAG: efflux RND transporter permease subunit [Acidobacteriota bacterium]
MPHTPLVSHPFREKILLNPRTSIREKHLQFVIIQSLLKVLANQLPVLCHPESNRVKPQSERSRSSEEIAADLRRVLANIPGVVIRTRASGGQMMFGMRGGGGEERIQVEIRGYDLEIGEALANQVKEIMEKVEGITDVRLSRETGNPEELFLIDRQAAADRQLSVSQIGRTIQTVLTGAQASLYREGGEAQSPLARAVVGGLLSSTVITLIIVPVVYSLFEGKKSKKTE